MIKKIVNCRISKGKLVSKLDEGREIITPVELLTKWGILDSDVKPEQLEKYEIRNEGRIIYFPDIDDIFF